MRRLWRFTLTPRLGIALLAGFGSMMVLTAILGFSQIQRTSTAQRELLAAQQAYSSTEALLSQMRADLYRINIDVRDYLLDRDARNAADLKQQVLDTRERILSSLAQLEPRLALASDSKTIEELRDQIEAYIGVLRPPLEWSPEVKNALASGYTRNLLRRRHLIHDLAARLQAVNTANLQRAQAHIDYSQRGFREWLRRLTFTIIFLSLIVAATSTWWIFRLERRAHIAEQELRHLSHELVHAQEEERKSISRELHDQVGQMLTALRVEISNLGRIGNSDPEEFSAHLREAKTVAENAVKTVRDLAMGLRPSMLDDLGLGAAIGWQAREFSRLSGVPANVRIEGPLDALSDAQKTGLFRVVQEALTNITRHAGAHQVAIGLLAGKDSIELTVRDDGKGMDTSPRRRRSLGLLGIEERIRELGGEMEIESGSAQGTLLRAQIPRANT